MKIKLLCTLLVWFSVPLCSWAGKAVGNGGDVVVCDTPNGKTAEVLDHYETRNIRQWPIDLGDTQLPPIDKVRMALKRLEKRSPVMAKRFLEVAENFENDFSFPTGISLKDIPDSQETYIPDNCGIQQIAVQNINPFPLEKRVLVDQELWNMLDNENKATLILHETVYRFALMGGDLDSRWTRYFTSLLLSPILTSTTGQDWMNVVLSSSGWFLYENSGLAMKSEGPGHWRIDSGTLPASSFKFNRASTDELGNVIEARSYLATYYSPPVEADFYGVPLVLYPEHRERKQGGTTTLVDSFFSVQMEDTEWVARVSSASVAVGLFQFSSESPIHLKQSSDGIGISSPGLTISFTKNDFYFKCENYSGSIEVNRDLAQNSDVTLSNNHILEQILRNRELCAEGGEVSRSFKDSGHKHEFTFNRNFRFYPDLSLERVSIQQGDLGKYFFVEVGLGKFKVFKPTAFLEFYESGRLKKTVLAEAKEFNDSSTTSIKVKAGQTVSFDENGYLISVQ